MTKEDLTARVRKLLALANNAGATEAEAANAAAKAAAIMREYEIEPEAVGAAPRAEEYREEARRFSRVATWQKVLAAAVRDSFGVFVYQGEGLHFYGQPHRVSAACYAFDALAENVSRAGAHIPHRDRAAFLAGCASVVAAKMRQAREESNLPALRQTPPPGRKFGSGGGSSAFTNRDAMAAGRAAGASIGIHAGLADHRKRLTA
jgi:hypothetical protein